MKKFCAFAIFFCCASFFCFADETQAAVEENPPESTGDENLEGLFDDVSDTVVEQTDIDHKSEFDQGKKYALSGHFGASAGASVGALEYIDEFKYSLAVSVNASASLDLRPTNYFRLFGRLETKVDPENFDKGWGGIEVDRIYADYELNDYVFLHMGNFPIRWGNGILFSPANLVSGIEDGFNTEISFPTLLDGVNLLGYARIRNTEKMFALKNFYFAANADKVVKKVRLSLGAKANREDGLQTYFSTKAIFSHFEPYAEVNYNFYDIGHRYFNYGWRVLGGTTFDIGNFSLVAEYYYDATDDWVDNDHNFGATLYYKRIFGLPINATVNVQHTLSDGTGGALLMLTYSAPRNAKVSLVFPFLWGDSGGRYTLSLSKNQLIMDDFTSTTEVYQNLDKRISVTLMASISMDF